MLENGVENTGKKFSKKTYLYFLKNCYVDVDSRWKEKLIINSSKIQFKNLNFSSDIVMISNLNHVEIFISKKLKIKLKNESYLLYF